MYKYLNFVVEVNIKYIGYIKNVKKNNRSRYTF